jgi:excisionase family DNA binding protein
MGDSPNGTTGRDLKYAAAFVGLSVHTVRQLARRKAITHYRLGRRLVFKDEDLTEYMCRHRVEARESAGR